MELSQNRRTRMAGLLTILQLSMTNGTTIGGMLDNTGNLSTIRHVRSPMMERTSDPKVKLFSFHATKS